MRPGLRILLVSLVIAGILIPLSADPVFLPSAAASHQMAKFRSYDEMIGFIKTQPSVCDSGNAPRPQPVVPPLALGPAENRFDLATATGSTGYSTTNVQVQGVDELDTVKTDGQYIYTITNNTLVIVKAGPADAGVVAKISNGESLSGVFVYGENLVLISGPNFGPYQGALYRFSIGMIPSYYYGFSPTTSLWVYDISNIANPALTFSLKENGTYVGSRLIDNSVYLITTQYANLHNDSMTLPARVVNGQLETAQPTAIYHSDVLDNGYSFTTVSRITLSAAPSENSESFLISSSGSLYVSMENIYLTSTIWTCNQETVIHRVDISNGISYEATGTVHGQVMNQFSMDEYNGFFRVATTTWPYTPFRAVPVLANAGAGVAAPETQVQSTPIGPITNVYVLNMDLHNVGSVEGISPGETFYAARFFGDRAYLVTFQRVDPLFVVDLKDPYRPQVLGQLQITGVSDYLQPYDENHLIGFGKSSVNVTWENAALFQGLKFSLFDVTDPTHPIDTSDFLVGDRGSDSLALTDSHAVLFAHDLNLLVVPVEIAQISGTPTSQWESGTPIWQGAYVFTISPSGIMFRGGITHLSSGELPSYSNSDHFVSRSLYIGNVLYTISPAMVKMNSLTDLSDMGSVTL